MARLDSSQDDAGLPDDVVAVLESAARLQRLVPDAVLVGGTAAALHARHRSSFDHDRIVTDLRQRFDLVLDALEREGDWVTNRATEGKIVLGELGGIEAGVRQLRRAVPLEVQQFRLPSQNTVTVPTLQETLRVKAFLIVVRNRVRDYLDVAALSDKAGVDPAAQTLRDLDIYYQGVGDRDAVASQLARQLADPQPADSRVLRNLAGYKNLSRRWQDWGNVVDQCRQVVTAMVAGRGEPMTSAFRNIEARPDDPVDEWGVEGILAAIDRGGITLWRRIADAVGQEPHGEVAADLEQALTGAESQASAAVLRLVLDAARETSEQRVARRVREAVGRSTLTRTEFARRLGTSPSRLSTYATGAVVPSAVMMDRIEGLADSYDESADQLQ